MTWAKFGVEFFDQCAEAGLSDPAVRTHSEALHYLYRLEAMDMRILKHLVRRFAGSDQWEIAVKDLVAGGFWRDDGDAYVLEHHADVFRQSLAAQLKHRETERERQRMKRTNVGPNPVTNVGPNVRATQTDRQTDREAGTEGSSAHAHAKPCDRCQSTPSRVNGAGARYCRTCSPAIWKDVSEHRTRRDERTNR